MGDRARELEAVSFNLLHAAQWNHNPVLRLIILPFALIAYWRWRRAVAKERSNV